VKRSVTVQIAGNRYSLKTDADERALRALASYVDTKMRDAQKGTRTVDTQTVAVLTALQIAEELFAERREARELRRSIREKSQSLLDTLEHEARV
jgi:cell division protein ZapA